MSKKNDLAQHLGDLLLARNETVATVESCTGGGLAYAITEVAGSSQWFNQSWVTYSNQAKHALVGVSQQTLDTYGAVSEQVVIEMATLAAVKANADLCIAVSGIAGPSGGTKDKPVGLVWFAIAGNALSALQIKSQTLAKTVENKVAVNSATNSIPAREVKSSSIMDNDSNNVITFYRRFSGDRKQVREQAIILGLEKLIQCLTN